MDKGDIKRLTDLYEKQHMLVPHLVEEYLKFLALKKEHQDFFAEKFSPSLLVDKMWHTHILDTQSYMLACGSDYIHHDPFGADDDNVFEQAKRYEATYNLLDETSKARKEIWPMPMKLTLHRWQDDSGRVVVVKTLGFKETELEIEQFIPNSKPKKRKRDEFMLFVKTIIGKTLNCSFPSAEGRTVRDLKIQIQNKDGTPTDMQTIFWRGKALSDDTKLHDIDSGAVLHMSVNLRGC